MAKQNVPANPIMLQCFYWEMGTGDYAATFPEEKQLWRLLTRRAELLASWGITSVWIPPAHKGFHGADDVGYGSYDLYDLGEFDQYGTVATKYGTKADLEAAVTALHSQGIAVYYDAVMNHLMGADRTELVRLSSTSPARPGEVIEAWSYFAYPGRAGAYSDFQWRWHHFDGTDFDERRNEHGIYLFKDKRWDPTCGEGPNYLMGMDFDHQHPETQDALIRWGLWITKTLNVDGFRLDAVKHMGFEFVNTWLHALQEQTEKQLFFVAEAWIDDAAKLKACFDTIAADCLYVFDFPLRQAFGELALDDGFPLGELGHRGLVNQHGYGERAVTFVENHDTERDGVIPGLFRYKYHAYAYILLRALGLPKVYWKDIYAYGMKKGVVSLMQARRLFAYGPGYEWEEACSDEVYAYVREGTAAVKNSGCVLLLGRQSDRKTAEVVVGTKYPDAVFADWTGNQTHTVTTDSSGYGKFSVSLSAERGWSVWVLRDAAAAAANTMPDESSAPD